MESRDGKATDSKERVESVGLARISHGTLLWRQRRSHLYFLLDDARHRLQWAQGIVNRLLRLAMPLGWSVHCLDSKGDAESDLHLPVARLPPRNTKGQRRQPRYGQM